MAIFISAEIPAAKAPTSAAFRVAWLTTVTRLVANTAKKPCMNVLAARMAIAFVVILFTFYLFSLLPLRYGS